MPSPPPLCTDTYYHIFSRGINRETIFVEDRTYAHFLSLYAKYVAPVADTFAYCLLRSHFHVLVKIKSEEEIAALAGERQARQPPWHGWASRAFSDFLNAYAKAVNNAYGRTGSLFQHPFGRVVVTSDVQFLRVVAYIHQNPQKHGLVDDFRRWKHSSYAAMLSDRPTRLKRETVLEWFGGRARFVALHADWVSQEHSRAFAGEDDD